MIQFIIDNGLSPAAFAVMGTLLVLTGLGLWWRRPYLAAALAALGLVGAAAPATVGLPIALTNAALMKLPANPSVAVFPILRLGVNMVGDAPPSWWVQQSGPCAAADVGSCNNGSDGNSFISVVPADGLDVRQFGAKGDNATDNTTAIQNTYNAAGARNLPVVFPSGSFRLSSITLSMYNNITTRCMNKSNTASNGTKLIEINTTATMFNISNVSGIWFLGCTWTSVSQQTAGSYLSFTTTNTSGAIDFWMDHGWDPIMLLGGNTGSTNANGTTAMYFVRGQIRDFNKTGVTIAGGQDQYFNNIVMDQDNNTFTPTACFYTEQNGGAITISDSDFLHCHDGFWMNPGNGQFVNWPYLSNVFFDSSDFGTPSGFGVAITPHGGGIFNGFQATNLWTSTNQTGFYANADVSSSCSVIQITQLHALTNVQAGASFTGCDRVSIINPTISGNSTGGTGNYPGIDLLAGNITDSVSIVSGVIGSAERYGVTQKAAIGVETGFQGRLTADTVDLTGNNTALAQGTVTYQPNSFIKASPGYNPAGAVNVVVGASPFTYTAGLTNESIAITGGATATVAIGGTQICPSSTSNCFVNLGPLQSLQITYSGGTPVVRSNRD